MENFKRVSKTLILVLALFSINASANESRGRIVKIQGDVHIINDKGETRSPGKSNFLVNNNETVVTEKGSKAVIEFDDGALSVLNEKSKIKVEKAGWLSHLSGKIYYFFKKVSSKEKPRKVKTAFTTIGIRGTTFIVSDETGDQRVALEEGKLNIESPDEPYEIHKPTTADDFESFKKQLQEKRDVLDKEYSDYKDKVEKDFVEYKKSFDLEANRVISFSGNRVDETELSGSAKDEFGDFSDYAKEHLKSFKELEDSTN